tara:strand:- start:30329 stop:30490 length:162 start_codon:yes stop_codon:yes gene_type:complete
MRLSEYIHWLNRDDIGMASNPKEFDYTHLRPSMLDKRARYLYQCALKNKKPVK